MCTTLINIQTQNAVTGNTVLAHSHLSFSCTYPSHGKSTMQLETLTHIVVKIA
jgi:hypothetical protein